MKNNLYDVVIIGGGLAGLKAAETLSESDLKVALIDENPFLGGQYLRTLPESFTDKLLKYKTKVKKEGLKLIEFLNDKRLDIFANSTVIGIYEDNKLLFDSFGETKQLNYKNLIISTGARERYLPFPGWTLPGVFSLGAIQVFLKSNGVLPADEITLAGSGPFLYAVAYEILKAGGKVKAIYELKRFGEQLSFSKGLINFPSKIIEAFVYMEEILSQHVPIKYGRIVIEAEGEEELQRVKIGKLDKERNIIEKSIKTMETELLGIGYGFVPNLETARAAGVEIIYREELGGWIAKVDEELKSNKSNIFLAGELTGIGGAEKSLIEGELAALSLLNSLNLIKEGDKSRLKSLVNKRKKALNYAKYFNTVYSIPLKLYSLIYDETIICRCENINMKKIREAIELGPANMNFVKTFTRAGMGNCQGRICGPIIENIIKSLKAKAPEPSTTRRPLKPILIGNLKKFYEKEIKGN